MIGPKCIHCKKQSYLHRAGTNACPAGKRSREFGYWDFSTTTTFEAKEKSNGGAAEKRKRRKVRREIKSLPCVVCGEGDCDPAHIRPWSVSQCDEPWNIATLCRFHHSEQHRIGIYAFAKRYPAYGHDLELKGWAFTANESTGDWSMWNEKEVEFNHKRRAI